MKNAVGVVVLMTAVFWGGLILGGCVGDKAYYSRNQTTVEELQETWGYPHRIWPGEDGAEIHLYSAHDQYFDNRYFIVKDGIVIDGGVGLQR